MIQGGRFYHPLWWRFLMRLIRLLLFILHQIWNLILYNNYNMISISDKVFQENQGAGRGILSTINYPGWKLRDTLPISENRYMSLISTLWKTGLNEIFEGGNHLWPQNCGLRPKITPKNEFILLIKLKLARPPPLSHSKIWALWNNRSKMAVVAISSAANGRLL